MQPTYCIDFLNDGTSLQCAINFGEFIGIPIFNHYGNSDPNPSRPTYCDCETYQFYSGCSETKFLLGFLFYNSENLYNSNNSIEEDSGFIAESVEPLLRLYEAFGFDYVKLNRAAYNATLHRSQQNLEENSFHPEDFDFCYDNKSNSYCTIMSILSVIEDPAVINLYGKPIINGSCSAQFSVDSHAW